MNQIPYNLFGEINDLGHCDLEVPGGDFFTFGKKGKTLF